MCAQRFVHASRDCQSPNSCQLPKLRKDEKRCSEVRKTPSTQQVLTRCESIELDNKIRDLIERNASNPKGVTIEATPSHRFSCSPKTCRERASMAHLAEGTAGMNAAQSTTEHTELLEVNQQWDQQFRNMKELYERKVAELKMKLVAAERVWGTLEKERQQQEQPQSQRVDTRPRDQTRDPQLEKEKENLNEEIQELKKENKLLKEKNALANKKKEHYECEIKRLNKALQDVLKIESSSSFEDCAWKSKVECNHTEMITEMEVLKQQVQIYEEDFKKERSDRERLSQEKEELQQINQTSQSQLNRLTSQIKACQMEKEKLERQLKQMYLPSCNCGTVFHLRDPSEPAGPQAVQDEREHPPDYQWYALDQLPPDVQHKANAAHRLPRYVCLVVLPLGADRGVDRLLTTEILTEPKEPVITQLNTTSSFLQMGFGSLKLSAAYCCWIVEFTKMIP
ncbi:TNFAIP3-interacting protein 3 [Fukomys damarensis]|uniref:TNFAIP3-interacting protein 3 n=1 Tax=Fukomys damarensis TaxID=885580 RepID=A0A091E2L7_FUKDA|nr:TNFAIP3-interacting protein 3 [Fukomys damarensis]